MRVPYRSAVWILVFGVLLAMAEYGLARQSERRDGDTGALERAAAPNATSADSLSDGSDSGVRYER